MKSSGRRYSDIILGKIDEMCSYYQILINFLYVFLSGWWPGGDLIMKVRTKWVGFSFVRGESFGEDKSWICQVIGG